MKKQQIISITGISFMSAIFFGEGCCCPTLPIGEILLIAAIADIFDWIGSNIGYIILGLGFFAVFMYVWFYIIGYIVSFFSKK